MRWPAACALADLDEDTPLPAEVGDELDALVSTAGQALAFRAGALAVEQAGGYAGLYFVLLGRLSPIDGIGPAELGLDLLGERAREEGVKEVILATNPTVEGEATA